MLNLRRDMRPPGIGKKLVHAIVSLVDEVEIRLENAHAQLQSLQQLQSKFSILDLKRLVNLINCYNLQGYYNSIYFKQSTMWRDGNPIEERRELIAHFKKKLAELEKIATQITELAIKLIQKKEALNARKQLPCASFHRP